MKIGAFLLRLARQYAFGVFVVDVVVVHNSLKIAQQKKMNLQMLEYEFVTQPDAISKPNQNTWFETIGF